MYIVYASDRRRLSKLVVAQQEVVNQMAGDPVTPAAKNSSDNARVVRRRVSKFSTADKENFNVYGGNVGENQKKSPLPVGYPRRPLHDITAVLQSFDDQVKHSVEDSGFSALLYTFLLFEDLR